VQEEHEEWSVAVVPMMAPQAQQVIELHALLEEEEEHDGSEPPPPPLEEWVIQFPDQNGPRWTHHLINKLLQSL
jgi:hypothetical protein